MGKENLPMYFEMDDDYYVKVDYDPKTDEVFGITAGGSPFPPIKAEFEGVKTTEEAFNKRAAELQSSKASESIEAASL